LKFGSLNLLEPSGSVQACNGIALPFYLGMFDLRGSRLCDMIGAFYVGRCMQHLLTYDRNVL
jgi:hypothetical protein